MATTILSRELALRRIPVLSYRYPDSINLY
jgi:hypothetical protein